MTTFKRRLAALETSMGINSNMPIVVFRSDPHDHDWIEQQAEIEQLKSCGKYFVLVSQGDGYGAWKNGRCISDGGLGHE